MAERITLHADGDVATWSSGIAAGAGDHLPVGYYGGAKYRSAIRFDAPGAWDGWTKITQATLNIWTSDHSHVAPKNSSIYVRRMPIASLWTKAPGGTDCETGFSAGNNTQYDDIAPVSADQATFSSGSSANYKRSIGVTLMTVTYWENSTSHLVFVLDPVSSSDYAEFWADGRGAYLAELVIDYEVQSPPTAPTLVYPNDDDSTPDDTPTFDWTHHDPQGDPQTSAEVRLHTSAGVLVGQWPVSGSTSSLVCPVTLPRSATYYWSARTTSAGGTSPWATSMFFDVRGDPVVTIDAVRRMEFFDHAPRLRVNWTVDQTPSEWRVLADGVEQTVGWQPGAATSYLLTAKALVDNTPVSVVVEVRTSSGTTGSATRSFTPRFGLTTHHKDLLTAPANWETPVITPGSQPAGASLQPEYGSHPTSAVAPSAWYTSMSDVPKERHLFWRAWFIPSATVGPTLDSINIPINTTIQLLDKWGVVRNVEGLSGGWAIAPDEAVYGTRSVTADVAGAAEQRLYSFGVRVRQGRSYILTGLMKSRGNSGAQFRLEDGAGNTLHATGIAMPPGPCESIRLTDTLDWFKTSEHDVHRYRTPVYVAEADASVYVVLRVGGAAGAKAWFDAIKLEESTVATPWSPAAIGATVIDAGGVQIDAFKGGVFRLKGSANGARDQVTSGPNGLVFGGDANLYSPSADLLKTDDAFQAAALVTDQLTVDGAPMDQLAGLRVQRGTQSIALSAATQSPETTITYPVPFSGVPMVVVSAAHTAAVYVATLTGNPGTSSFVCRIIHRDATATTATPVLHWIAIGPV